MHKILCHLLQYRKLTSPYAHQPRSFFQFHLISNRQDAIE